MTQLKLEKREGRWSPFKAIGQADKFIEDLMVPSIGKELATDQNLDFPNLMNADNKKLEQFLTMYGGYKGYLETKISDIEAIVGALEAAFTESYNTALFKVVREYEDNNKKKPTKEELRGELFSRFDALKELKQQLIDKEVLYKKTAGLLSTYTTAYSTVSRVVALRTYGNQL